MIAMALALDPKILIMDEPTTSLDVVVQRGILDRLMDLRARMNCSVVFITHDLSLLLELADRIAVMYAGRIVEIADSASLRQTPLHPYTSGLLSSFPVLRGQLRTLSGIPGSPPDLRHIPPGCAFHPRCRERVDACARGIPPLAEVVPRREVACLLRTQPAPAGDAAEGVHDGQ
jgi:peptide/nickel transport system ATP-binding protein